ncbi:MAG: DnaD domain protein [Erysipelotrichaceae bacterium]|nr:DnaD domain protein [Erysipelotrichaceae bacterium]MDY6033993.1 DnaD domain protein [Bulleidia sp.]
MKWYEQKYVNRRDWLLDKSSLLGMSPQEMIVVLLIDFMNEHRMEITMDALGEKTGLSTEELNRIISALCAKKYLLIKASARAVVFDLSGLYETDTARVENILDRSLFETFESEFGRLLSQKEMEKISDWNQVTDKRLIIAALREASAYQHLNLGYIEKILSEWKEKGITMDSLSKEK